MTGSKNAAMNAAPAKKRAPDCDSPASVDHERIET